MTRMAFIVVSLLAAASSWAAGVEDITNYREYSPTLSSSGQPTAEQLAAAREAGFERVVYLAFSDHNSSLEHEDRVTRDLGMEYVQIPVVWDAPAVADFNLFAAVLGQAPDKRTLVHCQVNFRASSFSFLYRVLQAGVPMGAAKQDLNSVWVPNETWRDWIFAVLAANGQSPDCEDCLWE